MENMLTRKKNQLFHVYIAECEDDIAHFGSEVEVLTSKLEEERQKQSGLAVDVRSLNQQHKSMQKEYDVRSSAKVHTALFPVLRRL